MQCLHCPARPLPSARSRLGSARCRAGPQPAERDLCATPHSGYHDDGTPRRFFEGWYFRVTLPVCSGAEAADSFAFMYSVEEPGLKGARAGVGAQVMGPSDGYLVQHARATQPFWADRHRLALGHAFRRVDGADALGGPVDAARFDASVLEGFQATATLHQGALRADSATVGPGPASTVPSCSWAFAVQPRSGWGGGASARQRATAGWLAALPVFEPHWQVLQSHGLAAGWVQWGARRYHFTDAPTYSEKNWGCAFPRKWAWAQCNAFEGLPGLAVTAVAGVRDLPVALPLLPRTEDVALIGIHIPHALLRGGGGGDSPTDGESLFLELVPWNGVVTWEVSPWGAWRLRGRSADYEAVLTASCLPGDGTVLRAPTAHRGLAAVCRDTFAGRATLCVWDRRPGAPSQPLVCASSTQAALEVGGGPWFTTWVGRSRMAEPLRSAASLPIDVQAIADALGSRWDPPGL